MLSGGRAPQSINFVFEDIYPESSTSTLSYYNLNIAGQGWFYSTVGQYQYYPGTHSYTIEMTVEETTDNDQDGYAE